MFEQMKKMFEQIKTMAQQDCRGMVEEQTVAEQLLDIAQQVKHTPGLIIPFCMVPINQEQYDTSMARVHLALKLRDNPSTALRAIIERWPRERIVSELF